MEHRSHNVEVVGHYVIMNSYVPCVFRQIGIAHVIQPAANWTVSSAGEFISLGMILKENYTVLAGIGWFIFDRDSSVLLWSAQLSSQESEPFG